MWLQLSTEDMAPYRHLAILFAAILAPVAAYQNYQANVPNGFNVPGAPGVGHVARGGGGSRNAFGMLRDLPAELRKHPL